MVDAFATPFKKCFFQGFIVVSGSSSAEKVAQTIKDVWLLFPYFGGAESAVPYCICILMVWAVWKVFPLKKKKKKKKVIAINIIIKKYAD